MKSNISRAIIAAVLVSLAIMGCQSTTAPRTDNLSLATNTNEPTFAATGYIVKIAPNEWRVEIRPGLKFNPNQYWSSASKPVVAADCGSVQYIWDGTKTMTDCKAVFTVTGLSPSAPFVVRAIVWQKYAETLPGGRLFDLAWIVKAGYLGARVPTRVGAFSVLQVTEAAAPLDSIPPPSPPIFTR